MASENSRSMLLKVLKRIVILCIIIRLNRISIRQFTPHYLFLLIKCGRLKVISAKIRFNLRGYCRTNLPACATYVSEMGSGKYATSSRRIFPR